MCEHCGCRQVPPIGELMDEHTALLDEAHHVRRALDVGDRVTAMACLDELVGHLARHVGREEAGIFAALRADGEYVQEVELLEGEHRGFDAAIAGLDVEDEDFEAKVALLLRRPRRPRRARGPRHLPRLGGDAGRGRVGAHRPGARGQPDVPARPAAGRGRARSHRARGGVGKGPVRCRTCDTVRSVDAQTRRERFEAVVPALVDPLRRFLVRRTDPATADDVLADTLLVCWRRIDELPDEPLPWAYAVARRCLANAERGVRRQRRVAAKIAVVDPPTEWVIAPEEPDHPTRRGAGRAAARGRRAAPPVGVGAADAGRDRDRPGHHPQRRQHPAAPGAREAARPARKDRGRCRT